MSCIEGMVVDAEAMDELRARMEREEIVRRLASLVLNGGSHENLSAICGAIYESDWGWTRGTCYELREKLICLIGSGICKNCDSCGHRACARVGGDAAEVTDDADSIVRDLLLGSIDAERAIERIEALHG